MTLTFDLHVGGGGYSWWVFLTVFIWEGHVFYLFFLEVCLVCIYERCLKRRYSNYMYRCIDISFLYNPKTLNLKTIIFIVHEGSTTVIYIGHVAERTNIFFFIIISRIYVNYVSHLLQVLHVNSKMDLKIVFDFLCLTPRSRMFHSLEIVNFFWWKAAELGQRSVRVDDFSCSFKGNCKIVCMTTDEVCIPIDVWSLTDQSIPPPKSAKMCLTLKLKQQVFLK